MCVCVRVLWIWGGGQCGHVESCQHHIQGLIEKPLCATAVDLLECWYVYGKVGNLVQDDVHV